MTTDAAIDRYHRWVAKEPCMHCDIDGWSQCSHYEGLHGDLFGRGGSKKAHFMCVTSLCTDRPGMVGCHTLFDGNKLSAIFSSDQFSRKIDKSEMHLCWIMQTIINAVTAGVLKLP